MIKVVQLNQINKLPLVIQKLTLKIRVLSIVLKVEKELMEVIFSKTLDNKLENWLKV
jgi:hypothetical protein